MSEMQEKIAKMKATELENRRLKAELQHKFLRELEKTDLIVYPDRIKLYAEVIAQLSISSRNGS